MTQIFTAKTVEEARALAARTFGRPEADITFEVLEEPKKGFLGFKKGEAKIKATYVSIDISSDDHRNQNAAPKKEEVKAASVMEEETSAPVEETSAEEAQASVEAEEEAVSVVEEAPAEEEVQADSVTEEAPAEEVEAASATEEAPAEEEAQAASATEEAPAEQAKEEKNTLPNDEDLVSGEPSEAALAKIEAAKAYLSEIFRHMGVEAEFEVKAGAQSAIIDILTPNSGTIIGRRGDTLDSLQYLAFLAANRCDKEYYRIILNSADYRERRRKTLEELGAKIAKSVLRSGRTQSLEPMNPYERRIVHSTISEIEGVSSRSVGEEPYRKVVISPTNAKPNRRRRPRNDRNDNRDHRKSNHRDRRNSDTPPERISMDSMKTSFEKDYKRPKAEDEINAGLYGKIEF